MERVALVELIQGRKIINPGGYPPDEIRFVANERRAPFLANDRRAFPRCSVHLIDWKRRSTLIGHKLDLIRRISTGGIYDFPALALPPCFNQLNVALQNNNRQL